MTDRKPVAGDAVRITADAIGVLDPDATRPAFLNDVILERGDEGRYVGPAPDMEDAEDWHLVSVERDGKTYNAPVHSSMFEVVDE